jgi:hypothetical protein
VNVDCLHDPEEYGSPEGCQLCAVRHHPARKAMAESLFEDQYGDSNEFVGERMDMCEEIVDRMISAAMQVGWVLYNPAGEPDEDARIQ